MVPFALLEIETGFHRISGYEDMPKLVAALERRIIGLGQPKILSDHVSVTLRKSMRHPPFGFGSGVFFAPESVLFLCGTFHGMNAGRLWSGQSGDVSGHATECATH